MASDSRALTLKLLADTADFQKKLADGSKDVESIGDRVTEFGKKAAAAFAVVSAAVGAFAVSAVKAAAEDEAAQKQLANTIQVTTDATAKQIAGVEQYIKQTSIAIGVTDDQLRPAFARLVRSTKDVEDAQKLLNLALDIASATGRPLESVANALGRAYDGNTTALGRLGLGLDANLLKSKDTDAIFKTLTDTFGNFAENEALSTQKQMERVSIALNEAKESIGAALLPVVQELTAWILNKFVPALEAFIHGLTGAGGLDGALTDSQKTAQEWGKKVRGFIDTVIELKDELLLLSGILATVFVVSKIASAIQGTILLINGLVAAYTALRNSAVAAAIAERFALNPLAGLATGAALVTTILAAIKLFDDKAAESTKTSAIGNYQMSTGTVLGSSGGTSAAFGGTSGLSVGGLTGGISTGSSGSSGTSSASPQPTLIEQVAQENFIRNLAPGAFNPGGFRQRDEGSVVINVNSPSIIDKEAFSRAVVDALNDSNSRNGGGAGGFRGAVAV